MEASTAMTSLLLHILLLCMAPSNADYLFASNSSHILRLETDSSRVGAPPTIDDDPEAVFDQPGGAIVGLAIDNHDNLVFWSDISPEHRGIYRGSVVTGQPRITRVQKIVQTDIHQVNGLAVDWDSKHIYWTDSKIGSYQSNSKKGSIEVADYDGQNRRVLARARLLDPRGIVVDPITGFLFWNDQAAQVIERSRPDGSQRKVIVSDNVVLPNQMVVHGNELYWVDSHDKDLWQSALDGRAKVKLANLAGQTFGRNIFGLAINPAGNLFVSVWEMGTLVVVDTEARSQQHAVPVSLGRRQMFSLSYWQPDEPAMTQPVGSNECRPSNKMSGCSHLCLPISPQRGRCSCPSVGALTLNADEMSCGAPSRILLYALAQEGEIGFMDLDSPRPSERYLVGRSLRPVAVAYDPVQQVVYWSDVLERRVYRVSLNGSGRAVVLSAAHSIAIVDGLAVDSRNRRLYYSNLDMIPTDVGSFSSHRIESVGLDGGSIRTVVMDTEKPRALAVDSEHGFLYYSDCGGNAAVWRTRLDGSGRRLVRRGLDNPNGLAVHGDTLYVVDSHFKTRRPNNPHYPRPPTNGSLYMSALDGSQWREVGQAAFRTPFGVTYDWTRDQLYVSDWDASAVLSVAPPDDDNIGVVLDDVTSAMGVFYTVVSADRMPTSPCHNEPRQQPCQEICFADVNNDVNITCACGSYDSKVLQEDRSTCQIPENFLLFCDVTSIKLVSLDMTDPSVYTIKMTDNNHFSNLAALAYDPGTQGVYYSEVSTTLTRGLYYISLDRNISRLVYSTNSVAEGIVLDHPGKVLYWTDTLNGRICSVSTDGAASSFRILVSGLDQPRALQLDPGRRYLYWTEVGAAPRVGRVSLQQNTSDVETVVTSGLTAPNGLHLDPDHNRLFVADATRQSILECNTTDSSCTELPYVTQMVAAVYGLTGVQDALYYTDWKEGVVGRVDMVAGQTTVLARGLLRPTQMTVQYTNTPTCPPNHSCSDTCNPAAGGYGCTCTKGRILREDEKTCEDAGNASERADDIRCGRAGCPIGSVCSQQSGNIPANFTCQCAPGFQTTEDICTPCGPTEYKPEIGAGRCRPCRHSLVAITTPEGGSGCQCPDGLVWNNEMQQCHGNKSGSCPDAAGGQPCGGLCAKDGDCGGAQRCCAAGLGCQEGGPRCRDPVGQAECVSEGSRYYVGQTFQPNPCTTCRCLRNKTNGDTRYGGAACRITDCPPPRCLRSHQILESNQCCATCITMVINTNNTDNNTRNTQERSYLTFAHCPPDSASVVKLTMLAHVPYARHRPGVMLSDALDIDRDVTVRKTPSGDLYWWSKDPINVTWSASARSPGSGYERAYCNYLVQVEDTEPPAITCPPDTVMYTGTGSVAATWLPPQASDNAGPVSATQTRGPPWGSHLGVGAYIMVYNVTDTASNTNQCSWTITVQDLGSAACDVSPPNHGRLACVDGGKGIVSCRLRCNASHVINPTMPGLDYFRCERGLWDPPLTTDIMVMGCVEMVSPVVSARATLTFPGCIPDLDVDTAQIDLQQRMEHGVIVTSPYADQIITTVAMDTGCLAAGDGADALVTRLALQAHYGSEKQLQTLTFELERLLTLTQQYIGNGILDLVTTRSIRSYTQGQKVIGHAQTTRIHWSQPTSVRAGCATGQGRVGNWSCMVCPSGTSGEGATCRLCPADTYQDRPGQTTCLACLRGSFSRPGAYSRRYCSSNVDPRRVQSPRSGAPTNVVLVVGATLGTAVGLAVIVVVAAVVVRHDHRRRGAGHRSSHANRKTAIVTNFSNPLFSAESDGDTQTHGVMGDTQTHGVMGDTQTHGVMSDTQTHGVMGDTQTHGVMGDTQTHGVKGDTQSHSFTGAAPAPTASQDNNNMAAISKVKVEEEDAV